MKLGLVDVGGGMRAIYGAGVLDYCLDHGISFDFCVGVSAGSANIASYCSGQRGRNYKYYTDYSFRKEYKSLQNVLRIHSFVDLDYVYGTLSNAGGEYPLDYGKMAASGKEFEIVATNALTGRPEYFTMEDISQDNYDVMKASSCIPVIGPAYPVYGIPYFDGGMSDPIPVNRTFRNGCGKTVLVLTRPRDYYRSPEKDEAFAKLLRHSYPAAAVSLAGRARRYNRQLDLAKSYEKRGKLLILAPKDISGMSTLHVEREAMVALYKEGYRDAETIQGFLED